MATLVLQTTDVQVAKLRCLFFNMVKELKEIEWYGIKCNKETLITNIKKGLSYMTILNTGCTLTHDLDCEIYSFIKKNTSFCIYTDNSCGDTLVIEEVGPIS